MDKNHNTFNTICRRTAKKLKITHKITKFVVGIFFELILEELKKGNPVAIRGFGSFYFTFQKCNEDFYKIKGKRKVVKICRFSLSRHNKTRINGIVSDTGIKKIKTDIGGRRKSKDACEIKV